MIPAPDLAFRQHLTEGRFMLQRSRSTGAYIFYPRVAEPGTGETDLEWIEVSGRGVVYSTTVVRQKLPTPSYNVALIDLIEGPRMMSRVEGLAPEDVVIGMEVQARIVANEDGPLILFDPAEPPA